MTLEEKTRLDNLKQFCRSQRQMELIEAVIEHGGISKAARALSIRNSHTISRAIRRVEGHAALQGWSPEHDMKHVVPDSHYLKGTSTLYRTDEKGNESVALQWVKTNNKAIDMLEGVREFADALGEQLNGVWHAVPFTPPKDMDRDLLTVYALADLHLGMLAWSKETREDYDAKLASEALRVGCDLLVAKTPPSETAIIANLGDFFHFDNNDKQTTSGNILDTDGRWTKVVDLGVECLLYFVRRALEKHQTVKIINSVGNHDGQTGAMLPFVLKPYFSNEQRVIVEDTPRDHHYHRFGTNLLGFHHGHKTHPSRLPMAMVNDCLLNSNVDTEGVENMHWLTGHIHHVVKEFDGCLVESFRALCSKDAYHAGGGYRAGRELQAPTYHRVFGEDGRERVSFKRIQHYSNLDALKNSRTA